MSGVLSGSGGAVGRGYPAHDQGHGHDGVACRLYVSHRQKDDPTAVVGKDAKVIGVSALRVVDASSFALLPPSHPQSTVYALAEKISAKMIAGQ